jgi:hypothetical protein
MHKGHDNGERPAEEGRRSKLRCELVTGSMTRAPTGPPTLSLTAPSCSARLTLFRLSPVTVSLDHSFRDTPDLDLGIMSGTLHGNHYLSVKAPFAVEGWLSARCQQHPPSRCIAKDSHFW